MLRGLRLAKADQVLDAIGSTLAYLCLACGAQLHSGRTRCALCGDRRHRITSKFQRTAVVANETALSALAISDRRSFMWIPDSELRSAAVVDPELVSSALRHIQAHFAVGTFASQRTPRTAARVTYRTKHLLAKVGVSP